MRRLIYIILFSATLLAISNLYSKSQTKHEIDSLLHILKISNDSSKIYAFKKLAWKLRNINPSSAFKYGLEGLQRSITYNLPEQEASLYNYLGVIRRNQNEYSKALDFYFKALSLSEKTGNKTEIAYAYGHS